MQGDCLERMKEIQAGSIDMILADPPYGTTQNKWDSVIDLGLMWAQLKRVIKPNGAIVMMASQPFTTTLISSNMKMFKYCWVWEKSQSTGHLNAWRMPMRAHEDITVFYSKPPLYNPELKDKPEANIRPKTNRTKNTDCYGTHKLDAHKCPADKTMPNSVLRFNNAQGTTHPTQKPVALMEYLIKTYTNEGETILDFTMGSGTTGVACVNTGRQFIGIELDESYFKISKDRIKQAI
ncbi:MAG: site-specific DNA-methyltransferase [Planctomycetes bacterium]|nr:site-specific DNA-methyltransferase [Planctomycetota bacterium]